VRHRGWFLAPALAPTAAIAAAWSFLGARIG
jgi:hypothetical protein